MKIEDPAIGGGYSRAVPCPVPVSTPAALLRAPADGKGCGIHRMPFGPRPVDERDPAAGYQFRLWAPDVRQVDVCLLGAHGERRYRPCARSAGWHTCRVREARTGDLYAFRLDGGPEVPDPASRCNPQGVHGPSLLIDPRSFVWDVTEDVEGVSRTWAAAAIHLLHIGAFSAEGSYAAAEAGLDKLAALGVDVIELMPLTASSGEHGECCDGVLPFAPQAAYGSPDELKHFIRAAHRRGLRVLLDVVYKPRGACCAPSGDASGNENPASAMVRNFFIHNALYWLEEYRFDGLRLNVASSLCSAAQPDFLEELAAWVCAGIDRRHVHLVQNGTASGAARSGVLPQPGYRDAQWDGDFHDSA